VSASKDEVRGRESGEGLKIGGKAVDGGRPNEAVHVKNFGEKRNIARFF